MKTDTIAAIATGMSNSGVRIVRISGEQASSAIDSILWSRKRERVRLSPPQSHAVHYGYIYNGDEEVGEAPVIIMKGSHGYTAEDTVKINCHGGVFMIRRILETVPYAGARTAKPGEFTERTFLNGGLDLSQAEVVANVTHIANGYALKSSVSQLGSSVSAKIKELRSWILYRIASIESALGGPEHMSLGGYGNRLMDDLMLTIGEVGKLLLSADDGRVMSEEVKIIILGKLNTGKSSLMSALLGEERVIATGTAGITRDILEEHVYLQGISLNVIDTAGIRDTEDMVKKTGVGQMMKAAGDIDLVIYVVDGSRSLDESGGKTIEFIRDRKTIVLLNKSDSDLEVGVVELEQICGHKVLLVSAGEEQGIELLEQEIRELFYHDDLSFNGQAYTTNARHKEALGQCLESLLMVRGSAENNMPEDFHSIDSMNAYEQLGFIIGGAADDDVINEIFAKFRIGKQRNLIWKRDVE